VPRAPPVAPARVAPARLVLARFAPARLVPPEEARVLLLRALPVDLLRVAMRELLEGGLPRAGARIRRTARRGRPETRTSREIRPIWSHVAIMYDPPRGAKG
jgi:hypothetical protein